ncbi:hypothetical protein PLICRDRAFT_596548 [Plicaturopsis crispa FD-325 SS-3]|nr:hypothetical protein PLICRDRAFT_596548 [Plicaturopsis crispa FD-325 SS-3]
MSESEQYVRRVPTLVSICQRVASAHVEVASVTVVCEISPYIQKDTPEIWRDKCFRAWPLVAERYLSQEEEEPESWRDQYFVLREAEAKRIEEIGSRIRNRRLEAEERTKEKEIKLTDRIPPTKRARGGGWSGNPQPKTLFQKTRSEASKLQKNMYSARMVPPMPTAKQYRVLPSPASAELPPPPSTMKSARVTVRTVAHRRPSASSTSATSSATSFSPISSLGTSPSSSGPSSASHTPATLSNTPTPLRPSPKKADAPPPNPKSAVKKKDPMASMFMPKHRTFSQLPSHPLSPNKRVP